MVSAWKEVEKGKCWYLWFTYQQEGLEKKGIHRAAGKSKQAALQLWGNLEDYAVKKNMPLRILGSQTVFPKWQAKTKGILLTPLIQIEL